MNLVGDSAVVENYNVLKIKNCHSQPNDGAIFNSGILKFSNDLTINQKLTNNNKLIFDGNITFKDTLFNNKVLQVQGTLKNNGVLVSAARSYIETNNVELNGTAVSDTYQCSKLKVNSNTKIGDGFVKIGSFDVCDVNGIEEGLINIVPGSTTSPNLKCDCDVDTAAYPINETMFRWSPQTGVNDPTLLNPVVSPTSTTVYTLTTILPTGLQLTNHITVYVKDVLEPSYSVCKGDSLILTPDLSCIDFSGLEGNCIPTSGYYEIHVCDDTIGTTGNYNLNDGRTYCIAKGDVFTGNLSLSSGTLVVEGEIRSNNFNFSSGEVVNNGTIAMNSLNSNGHFVNNGILETGHFNVNSDSLVNYGTVLSSQVNSSAPVLNYGSIVSDNITFNDDLNNYCTIEASGNVYINGIGANWSNIVAGGQLTLNNELQLFDYAYIKANNLTVNNKIISDSSSSSFIKVANNVVINGAIDGSLSMCVSSQEQSKITGDKIKFTCIREYTPSYSEGISYKWSPNLGLSSDTARSPIFKVDSSITYELIILKDGDTLSKKLSTVTIQEDCHPTLNSNIVVVFDPDKIDWGYVDSVDQNTFTLSDILLTGYKEEIAEIVKRPVDEIICSKRYPFLIPGDEHFVGRDGEVYEIPQYLHSTYNVVLLSGGNKIAVLKQLNSLASSVISAYDIDRTKASITSVPNDNHFYRQTSMFASNGCNDCGINVVNAWKNHYPGDNTVSVGVLDTGIDVDHEDFNFNGVNVVKGGYEPLEGTVYDPGDYNDKHNHGTSCAGIIGAVRNNGIGVSGIAGGNALINKEGVSLYALQLFYTNSNDRNIIHYNGSSDILFLIGTLDRASGGLELDILSNSWAGGGKSLNSLEEITFRLAARSGVVNVAARGNNETGDYGNDELLYPACYYDPWVLNVGASGDNGQRLTVDNREGSVVWSTYYGGNMDFLAPGSAEIVYTTGVGDNYKTFWGTSAATPHVAGAAALMLSYYNTRFGNERLLPEDIEHLLQKSCNNKGPLPGYDDESGFGLININAALNLIKQPKYKIRHYSANWKTMVNRGTFENIEVEGRAPYIPHRFYRVERYRLTGCGNLNLQQGDEFVDMWPLHNKTDMLKGTIVNKDGLGNLAENNYCKVTGINETFACFEGYVYKLINPEDLNEVYWIPFNPNEKEAKFHYSVHTYNPTYRDPSLGVLDINNEYFGFNVYPNPSASLSEINLNLNISTEVTIEIHNLLGEKISVISHNEVLHPGEHVFEVDKTLPSGTYIFTIETNKGVASLLHQKL